MPNFTVNTIYDTYQRAVVQFLWGGGTTVTSYGLTGVVYASSLTGYDTTLGASSSAVDIDVSKMFWSLPQGFTSQGVEVAWGISGSLTGTPFMYLNNGGYVNFSADAIKFTNSYTGADRRNYIQLRNVNALASTDTISVILEIDKGRGYIRQM
jgi:hypothetical protein